MKKQDEKETITVDDLIEANGAESVLKLLSTFNDDDVVWAKNLTINLKLPKKLKKRQTRP